MSAFADKVAIVTGGASGIGRALGQELAQRGARVVLADINGQSAQAAADAMTSAGGRAQVAARGRLRSTYAMPMRCSVW